MRKAIREYKKLMIAKTWEEKKGTWTMEDIGDLFGCSVTWVYSVLKEVRDGLK